MRSAVRKATLSIACLVAAFRASWPDRGTYSGPVVDDYGPPGPHKVRFTLPKYSEVERNATVRLDAPATVDAKLFRLGTDTSSGN